MCQPGSVREIAPAEYGLCSALAEGYFGELSSWLRTSGLDTVRSKCIVRPLLSLVFVGTLASCHVGTETVLEEIDRPAQIQSLTESAGREQHLLSTRAPCEGPDADPWVTGLHVRVMSLNQLVDYAVELYGPPLTCDGAVTAEFDGSKFGAVRLGFAEGVTFEVETMPLETSVVTLRAPLGFDDEASARQTLQAYSSDFGLRIDWTTPTVSEEDDERVQSFWDPNAGLNGSASFFFLEDTLVALRFSVAL